MIIFFNLKTFLLFLSSEIIYVTMHLEVQSLTSLLQLIYTSYVSSPCQVIVKVNRVFFAQRFCQAIALAVISSDNR